MTTKETNKYSRKIIILVIAILLIAVVVLTSVLVFRNPPEQQETQPPPEPAASLKSPTDLTASTITATKISLKWKDNSNNEQGIRLYRDGVIIADLPENTTLYEDINLRPATAYTYKAEVYNQTESLKSIEYIAKTLNPPVSIWIEKIGVRDNGEDLTRDFNGGEVNIGVVVSDGKNTVQTRLPDKDFYQLDDDETIDVNQQVFSSGEIGDTLRIAIIGYEDDGGSGEQFIYDVMEVMVESYLGGTASIFLGLADIDLSDVVSKLFGAETDWLGTHVSEFTGSQNWGAGSYNEINCIADNDNIGLKLWFRIECPAYDYSTQ